MKILALIAARGGSKRLPGKNIRPLGGIPLIEWSIRSAMGLPQICDILVSTDDAAIAETARKGGASVPWLRPADLATDTASPVDVSLHALDLYEKENGAVDGLLLLQPTSPFRRRDTLMRGLELFDKHQRRPVLGVSPAASHPLWCYQIKENTLRPFMPGGGSTLRSQDLPPAYAVNGSFYLVTPEHLRVFHSFYGDDMAPLIMENPGENIDIDTERDWDWAEYFLAHRGPET